MAAGPAAVGASCELPEARAASAVQSSAGQALDLAHQVKEQTADVAACFGVDAGEAFRAARRRRQVVALAKADVAVSSRRPPSGAPGAGACSGSGVASDAAFQAGAVLGGALQRWRAQAQLARLRRTLLQPAAAGSPRGAATPRDLEAVQRKYDSDLQYHKVCMQSALQRTAENAQASKDLLVEQQRELVLASRRADERILHQEATIQRLQTEVTLERSRASVELKHAEHRQLGLQAECRALQERVQQLEQRLEQRAQDVEVDRQRAEQLQRQRRRELKEQLREGEERTLRLERLAEERRLELEGSRRLAEECALHLEQMAKRHQHTIGLEQMRLAAQRRQKHARYTLQAWRANVNYHRRLSQADQHILHETAKKLQTACMVGWSETTRQSTQLRMAVVALSDCRLLRTSCSQWRVVALGRRMSRRCKGRLLVLLGSQAWAFLGRNIVSVLLTAVVGTWRGLTAACLSQRALKTLLFQHWQAGTKITKSTNAMRVREEEFNVISARLEGLEEQLLSSNLLALRALEQVDDISAPKVAREASLFLNSTQRSGLAYR